MESGRLRWSNVNSYEIRSNMGARHHALQHVRRTLNATTNILLSLYPRVINIALEEIVSISTKTPFRLFFDVYITIQSLCGCNDGIWPILAQLSCSTAVLIKSVYDCLPPTLRKKVQLTQSRSPRGQCSIKQQPMT